MKCATLVCAMLALAGTGAVIWQQRSSPELRRPGQTVGFSRAATTDGTNAVDEQELRTLREQTRDLPRLRNEVGQLRAARADLDAARTENKRLLETRGAGAKVIRETPAGFTSKEQLKNADYTTPEATVESFFWAMRESRLDLMIDALSPEHRDRVAFEKLPAETRAQQVNGFQAGEMGDPRLKNFTDFTVAEKEQLSEDMVVLSLRSSIGIIAAKYRLKRIGPEWKIDDLPL